MILETLYEIGVKRHQTGATDAHGNPVVSWSNPETVKVYSIAPAYSNEPYEAGREAVITGLVVLAPPDTVVDERDRVVVNGDEYTVEGEVGNWNQGPFSWAPGVSITLKKVNG